MLALETDTPAERSHIEWIARLYLVVHGRPPDFSGLEAYVGHLRDGITLVTIAEQFVDSDEFRDRVGAGDARALLHRHALGPGGASLTMPPGQSLAELAVALVLHPAVQDHLRILPALYPDGVPWTPADYRNWLLGRPDPEPTGALGRPGQTPVLSVIILFDGPRPDDMAAAIGSVLALDAAVELLVAARFPRDRTALRAILANVDPDPRLRVVWCGPWSGHAGMFNRALRRCAGSFVTVIGQHDRLDASIVTIPPLDGVEIVVADDDRLGPDGLREEPRLGTDWDPDRVLAAGCPGVILLRTALVRRVGGMAAAGGRKEWALLVKAASVVPEAVIKHVPVVALSRGDSVSDVSVPCDIAVATGYLRAKGQQADVTVEDGRLRVTYPLPQPPPLASVIIPTKDRAELLRRCAAGLLGRTDYPALEVLIVDNGSTEADALALLDDLARDDRVRILSRPGVFNWSALNNAGVEAMRGQVAVLLNNDTDVLDPGWLRELVAQTMRPDVGIAGAKLLYGDGRIQHAGVVLGPAGRGSHMWRYLPGDVPGYLDQLVVTRRVTALTGACVAIRREVYEAVGGCNATHLPITWNDIDLCLKVRALGLQAIWTPHARMLHLEQASRGSDDTPANQIRFLREQAWMRERWGAALDHDPFRNPNLLPSEREMRLDPHAIETDRFRI